MFETEDDAYEVTDYKHPGFVDTLTDHADE